MSDQDNWFKSHQAEKPLVRRSKTAVNMNRHSNKIAPEFISTLRYLSHVSISLIWL